MENESTKAYRLRSQQETIASAVADECLREINFKVSEAIQEIDGNLRSCYMTGKFVKPTHEWYSDVLVVTTQRPSTVTVESNTATVLPSNEMYVPPIEDIEPVAHEIAGELKQSAGWFRSAKNKFMSLIHL